MKYISMGDFCFKSGEELSELVEHIRDHSRKTLRTEIAPWAKPLDEVEYELQEPGEREVIKGLHRTL